jgi:DNA-binding NtrC family response regulator
MTPPVLPMPPAAGKPKAESWLKHRLLVIDDDPGAIELARSALSTFRSEIDIMGVGSPAAALATMSELRPELVLLDLVMPGVEGFELLEQLHRVQPGADIILITAQYSTDSAVEAIQKGAYDYLTKPLPVERLRRKVSDWLKQAHLRERASELEGRLAEVFQFEGIIGRSPLILELFARIQRIAPHFTNALVTGETGTGKEFVARVLHQLSPAADGPFVVCNCAAIAETLFESELFGHIRGAFTGAIAEHTGLFEHASGGTIFLDEIGEVPLPVQAKLLRFLQSREIQRLGSPVVRRVDVRIVAATNRDLARMVAERTFREDLYYRLSMVELKTPRLADRREDIPLLVSHFLEQFSTRYQRGRVRLSRRAQTLMERYGWPGNVRELENALNYVVMMAERETIEVEDFPESIRHHPSGVTTDSSGHEIIPLGEMEDRYVRQVLDKLQGNRARTANALGIGRVTLYRMLKRMGLQAQSEARPA